MAFTLATWNINSVRLRLPIVLRFLEEHAPDVLCLQEIKCRDDQFPAADLKKAGYIHQAVYGFKGYHGVAILSRHPFAGSDRHLFCGKEDGRALTVRFDEGPLAGVEIANFYVPAGGDIPDPALNERFAHKLAFLDEFAVWSAARATAAAKTILVGDLNVAPLEQDVWSHKQLLDVVSHTPVECALLGRLQASNDWVDIGRHFHPAPARLYTWWSYRAKDWAASDRGRRLDHMWMTRDVADKAVAHRVVEPARSWEKPSDHIPIITEFAF